MNFDNAMELKSKILKEELNISATQIDERGIKIQSIDKIPQIGNRLAVGLSIKSKDNLSLEIRVQRKKGRAYNNALRWKEEANNEVNIVVVNEIQIPPKINIQETKAIRYFRAHKRPVIMGLSISTDCSGTGTLGGFVENSTTGKIGIITNNHVLVNYNNRTRNGAPVYQPGGVDESTRLVNRIGELRDYVNVVKEQINYLDVAVAELDEEIQYSGNSIPSNYKCPISGKEITMVGDISKIFLSSEKNPTIMKIGRSSGFTQGILTAFGVDGLPVRHPTEGVFLFSDVYEVKSLSKAKPFLVPGDSGSIAMVVNDNKLVAVGLLFASTNSVNGSGTLAYFCSLKRALESIDYDWLI